jgi:hypothetical protein
MMGMIGLGGERRAMNDDPNHITLDDFYKRLIKPAAEAGDPACQIMMAAWKLTKEGKMTPAIAREYAWKVMP